MAQRWLVQIEEKHSVVSLSSHCPVTLIVSLHIWNFPVNYLVILAYS